jgi:alanyl-tRNA synthetase
MTDRLYYTDPYVREFTAQIVDRSAKADVVYLDRTAFYPTSGGQPFDLGALGGVAIADVAEEDDGRIAHRLASPLPAGDSVAGSIDWGRRFDHMQQHTGQHLLSAVFEELFSLRTVSFHLGAESATVDLEGGAVDAARVVTVERRANEVVFENRPVTIQFEEAREARGLRKPSEREGTIRIITIESLDRSACGGTHVRATGEIGAICIRKLEKIRQSVRVEFVCGGRAVRRARADYDSLSKVAQLFSASLDDAAGMAAAALEAARAGEKALRKAEIELAGHRGKELYATTAPAEDGMRRVAQRAARGNLEDLRALAQSFTAQPKAVFLAVLEEPPSVLLAASEDAGVDAGKLVKAAVTAAGGRGGGNARVAQGSAPDVLALQSALAHIYSGIGMPSTPAVRSI